LLFVDPYINPISVEELRAMLDVEKKFGYRVVGIDEKFSDSSIDSVRTFPVKTITAGSEDEARASLRRLGKGVLVISRPRDSGSLRVFSRDSRAQIVEIPHKLSHLLDRNQADLLRVGRSFIGFSLSSLIEDHKTMWWLSFLVRYAEKYDLPLILFSGASRSEELAHPRIVFSILIQAGASRDRALTIIDGRNFLKMLGLKLEEDAGK